MLREKFYYNLFSLDLYLGLLYFVRRYPREELKKRLLLIVDLLYEKEEENKPVH